MFFKDRLFNNLNETDELSIVDIEVNDANEKMIINYENCLECGACRIACEEQCIDWNYPKGNKGVTFKQG